MPELLKYNLNPKVVFYINPKNTLSLAASLTKETRQGGDMSLMKSETFTPSNFYKEKNDYTDLEIEKFLEENKDQLKREYIDFKYVVLNPKNLIGLEEFNQGFFDEIDKIENKISQGDTFETILKNIKVNVLEIKEFTPTSIEKLNEDKIYSKRSSKIDLIENGDNFLLYSITNQYDRVPDLTDQTTKNEIRNLIYQKGKFDQNRSVLEEIQKKEFDNNKFLEIGSSNIEYLTLNSINDNNKFETNSVKILYSLPVNSFTNFIAIDCCNNAEYSKKVLESLIQQGVFVRMPYSFPQNRCIRVTAGLDKDIDLFEKAFPIALAESK